jgi:hypothetical protein
MPGKRKACDMEPQDRLVGRNLNVPCEYFGAETALKPSAKKAKKASPFIALVLKPVAIANQFYTGAGVEVRLARTVHNRDIWWLPLPHAAEFVANNEACEVCGEGDGALDHGCGEMLMCDGCPCSFHIGCIGLGSVPAVDEWFCDGECCGGPALRRPAQQEEEQEQGEAEEEQGEADSKAAARKPPKAKKQRKKTAAPPQSAVVDAAQEEERLFQQQLAQAVRKVQAERGMTHCHFWSLVAKAVGTADAEQCAAAWFDRVGSPQQQEEQQRHKAKVAAAAVTKRRKQEEQQQTEAAAAEAAAGAEGQSAAASASSSMPPPLAPSCPRLVVPVPPRNTPVAKLPGRGTVKHRALLRGYVEKQEAGHVDAVSMETPEQLFLSPSVDLDDDESPICFGGFGGGFGGGAIGFSPAAAAAAPLADRTNAAARSCGGAASSGGGSTPARMSVAEHDRYMVQFQKNRGKSRAEQHMDAIKAAGGVRAVKAKSGGYVYTAGAPPKARASSAKKARADGSHATQLCVGGHVAKATISASGHVVMHMPDLSEGDSDEERSSDDEEEEEEEEEEGGFAGGFSVPAM